jgi:hypothetical protein
MTCPECTLPDGSETLCRRHAEEYIRLALIEAEVSERRGFPATAAMARGCALKWATYHGIEIE